MRTSEQSEITLRWVHRPFRELVRLGWPMLGSVLSYSVMTLVDTMFVGRLGPAALAAVGLGGMAAFALVCFPIGVLRGQKILVSQSVGAGRHHELLELRAAGLVFAVAFGVVVVLAARGVAGALPLLTASEASGAMARTYVEVRTLSAPLFLVFVALREHRYGLGDTRGPMVAIVAANALNVLLDWIFIVELGYGVAGAAWATVLSQGLAAAVLLIPLGLFRGGLRTLGRRHLRALWSMGAPLGVEFLFHMGSFVLLSAMLAALSDVDIAAHQIALQVVHFTFLPLLAVSEAASVMAGQAIGAGRNDLIGTIAKSATRVAGTYAALCTLVLVLGAEVIARAFAADAALLVLTARLLQIAALFQIFDGVQIVAAGILRGTGDVRVPALVGVLSAWLLTPPLTLALAYGAGLGAVGGWIGLTAEIMATAVVLSLRLSRGAWRTAPRASAARLGDDRPSVA